MLKLILAGFTAAAALTLSGCARHTGVAPESAPAPLPPAGDYERLEGQVFTPEDWPEALTVDVYRPKAPGPHPAVLLVHGGGWTRRSPDDMADIAQDLAKRGLVAINVAYRFAPAYRFPAQLQDLQVALDWLAAEAERLDVDLDRVGAYGYSAGAHLASLAALVPADHAVSHRTAHPDRPRIRAVVAGGTPTDLRPWPNNKLVRELMGAPRDEALEAWTQASPIHYVSASAPPFFLYHGGLDRIVEPDQARNMQQALSDVGVPAELYLVPLHGHLSMFLFGSAVDKATAFLLRELAPQATARAP